MRIAIAGLGAAARTIHLPAYRKAPELLVVGGCDPAATASTFPFPVFADVSTMLRETKPDLLAVATPPRTHYEVVCAGIEHGCHVFCEKPFTVDLAQAVDIVGRAEQAGLQVVVNQQYRFMNIHKQAMAAIGTAPFGSLQFVHIEQALWGPGQHEWRHQGDRHTCLEFGAHALDLCRYFFGEDPVALTARMPSAGRPNEADYLNLIDLEFSNDRVAHLTLDRLCRGPHRYLSIRLDGSEGCIETQLGGGFRVSAGIRGGSRRPFVEGEFVLGGKATLFHGGKCRKIGHDPLDVFANATAELLRSVLAAITSGQPAPCNARDNCRTLALIEAAYRSNQERRTVAIAYPSFLPRTRP